MNKVYQCLVLVHKYNRYSGEYDQFSATFRTYEEANEFSHMCYEEPRWVAKILGSRYTEMLGEIECNINEIEILDYEFINRAKDKIAKYNAEWDHFMEEIEKESEVESKDV